MTRIEHDSIGTMEVAGESYYGIHALRAKHNFSITGKSLRKEMIISLAQIKQAAALVHLDNHTLSKEKAYAIIQACDDIIQGDYHDQFIVDPIQGGAGTSTNMNANEVIANRAIEILKGQRGDYHLVHPNDDVNMAQSTNDVYPTAGKLTILKLMPALLEQLERLDDVLLQKADEFHDVFKMGRTQLQDAVPMRLGQSFASYHHFVRRDIKRIKQSLEDIRVINMGATAIGTAINADCHYVSNIHRMLSFVCQEELYQADDLIDATQNLDCYVTVSSALKNCAVNLSKMANDLRLLSSGPKTGIGELVLPSMQNGSSIMPGKVNPVIPEVINQIAFMVIGHDTTIALASEAGQLELNAFEPVLFDQLFESITALRQGVKTLIDHCLIDIKANKERCQFLLDQSVALVTTLCPYIGYQEAANLAKTSLATNTSLKELIKDNPHFNQLNLDDIFNIPHTTDPIIEKSKY